MAREYLSDKEKRILFSAITRERNFCIDKLDNPSELVKICDSLDYCFMYDRIFKELEKDAYNKAIDDMVQIIKDMRETATAMMWIDREETCDKFIKQAEQLKDGE